MLPVGGLVTFGSSFISLLLLVGDTARLKEAKDPFKGKAVEDG